MLSEEKVQELQKNLQQEKDRLETELSSFADKKTDGDYKTRYEDFGDEEDDNAEEYRQHEVNLSLEQRLETALKDVTDALVRIDAGTYGKCEQCNADIQEKRLEAYPAARFCMEHAEAA